MMEECPFLKAHELFLSPALHKEHLHLEIEVQEYDVLQVGLEHDQGC